MRRSNDAMGWMGFFCGTTAAMLVLLVVLLSTQVRVLMFVVCSCFPFDLHSAGRHRIGVVDARAPRVSNVFVAQV